MLVPNGEQRHESQEHGHLQGRIRFAMISSLIANVLLLVAKIVAFILSQSKSVLASAADSFVDIASQVTNSPLDLHLSSKSAVQRFLPSVASEGVSRKLDSNHPRVPQPLFKHEWPGLGHHGILDPSDEVKVCRW